MEKKNYMRGLLNRYRENDVSEKTRISLTIAYNEYPITQ